ncbi:hypothetical protein EDC38_0488 [Marinimicrobium koreense]|uniref:Tetratricopeptide repeat protein n=2 Tax=Marinimicrobium koreense TaxID=306545 RepID=A0A3N1NY16_9GAMM|nr:hypothetical protein EDC38_0488 [Marinimicrobium koreense]
MNIRIFLVILLGWSCLAHAEPTIPESCTTLVAKWDPAEFRQADPPSTAEARWQSDPQSRLTRARKTIELAAKPGYSHFYDRARTLLEVPVEAQTDNPEVWLLWAKVQQHYHDFDAALSALERVFRAQPGHVEARLLAARIYLIQGLPDRAHGHCIALIGNADLVTASACALEVASYRQSLEASYRSLQALVQREGLPDDERGPWIAQILADMALRLSRFEEAESWLDPHLDGASVNYLLQWSEVQLALGNHTRIIEELESVVTAAPNIDDALALRLAIAEQATEGDRWKDYVEGRMALRLQRQDTHHASDLARYYLEVDPQPEKALHWAEINWEKAREHSDRRLLQQARRSVEKNISEKRAH